MVRLKTWLAGGGCNGGLSNRLVPWAPSYHDSSNSSCVMQLPPVLRYHTAGGCCKGWPAIHSLPSQPQHAAAVVASKRLLQIRAVRPVYSLFWQPHSNSSSCMLQPPVRTYDTVQRAVLIEQAEHESLIAAVE
jgi:hypothetical protein